MGNLFRIYCKTKLLKIKAFDAKNVGRYGEENAECILEDVFMIL